mmetsp:Transcript_15170/g.47159  ORF Transcript_15170/g.47159 Transcript_15170/m.47159 type:complete len:241 (-) Transcript_15170:201-923(-)
MPIPPRETAFAKRERSSNRCKTSSTSALRRGVRVLSSARSMENCTPLRGNDASQSASARRLVTGVASVRGASLVRVASTVLSSWSTSVATSTSPRKARIRTRHVRFQRCSVTVVVTVVSVSFFAEPPKSPLVFLSVSTFTVGPLTSLVRASTYVVVPPASSWSASFSGSFFASADAASVAAVAASMPRNSANARLDARPRRAATSAAENLSWYACGASASATHFASFKATRVASRAFWRR